ncbi:MAG TPA: DUF6159 family protein [Gaiellaceae bacterium]|nr:DUF6159 family protein [Gaiellaceae bacterium]
MSVTSGARLMRTSFDVVRGDFGLLAFPLVSTVCLAVVASFWILQGAYLHTAGTAAILYVPLVAVALYSLSAIGIFFNVALAAAAAAAVDGRERGFRGGIDVALGRIGAIAGWAAYSLTVSVALGFLESFKLMRWVGKAAEVAWSFATIFVVPLIAIEGLDASTARARSFQLARENWQAESGGLVTLRLVWLVPGLLFYLDGKLLFSGNVHSNAARAFLGLVLLCGFGFAVIVGVVRQVFAVSLFRLNDKSPAAA